MFQSFHLLTSRVMYNSDLRHLFAHLWEMELRALPDRQRASKTSEKAAIMSSSAKCW